MNKAKSQAGLVMLGGLCVLLSTSSDAQIRTIPKEGLPGLSKETIEFEIEHNYRRENGLGMTVPAEPGTKPGSTDPQNIEGIWITGRNYTVNADGSFTEQGSTLGMGAGAAAMGAGASPGGAPGAAPGGAPPGGAPGGAPGGTQGAGAGPATSSCSVSLSFGMGLPSKIVQTDKAVYIFHNSQNSGATYRRIEMNAALPASVTPTLMGRSVGHWEGDTLIVETIGVKASTGGRGGPGGAGLSVGPNSKITERIKKIEGGLKLEDIVSVEDTVTKQVAKQRVVSFYRPDLQYVEAPCEEYSDPFADVYNDPKASAEAVKKAAQSGK